ncbi:hypothetical protein ACFWGN_16125 [Oerskovia sp. NPDC060338]|uniref:hypothetical protein n=1 Tax=Oerskovia sp. NPDC060338 TaxID=3347100 RepID=UPI003656001C
MALNDAGTVEATVPLRARDVRARRDLLSYLEPTRCFLGVVADGEHVLEAGPIWKHSFDDADGNLKVGGAGLLSLFDHRKVLKVLDPGERVQDTAVTFSGLSLGTIAKRLVQLAMSHAGGSLPIILPNDEAGAAERTYPGFELGWVGERIQQLADVIGGPDVALQPRFTTDRTHVEWVLRTGTTAAPLLTQSGADWQWDRGVARGGLTGISVDVDATRMGSRSWAIGAGMESALMLATRTDPAMLAAGYPLLDVESSHTSVTEQSTLEDHATALAEISRRPWQTWGLKVRADQQPRLGSYRPGDWSQVHVPDAHVYLTPGAYRTRILAISGDLTLKVSLKLAPTMEAR